MNFRKKKVLPAKKKEGIFFPIFNARYFFIFWISSPLKKLRNAFLMNKINMYPHPYEILL